MYYSHVLLLVTTVMYYSHVLLLVTTVMYYSHVLQSCQYSWMDDGKILLVSGDENDLDFTVSDDWITQTADMTTPQK